MSDEILQEVAEVPEGLSPDIQSVIDAQVAQAKADLENQLRGLNRANSKLKNELDERSAAGKTIEERIAAIEREKADAVRRAETMEAFGRYGLTEDWRGLFEIADPEERAETLKSLLDEHTKGVQKTAASQFIRDPEPIAEGGLRSMTMEQMRGMDPQAIKKLLNEGRLKDA